MKSFKISIRTSFPEWDRYSVYLTAACFDAAGTMIDYVNSTDKHSPLETPECDHADLYLYVVAREFPASRVVAASPPFDIEVEVNGASKSYSVNQWGGLSVKQPLS